MRFLMLLSPLLLLCMMLLHLALFAICLTILEVLTFRTKQIIRCGVSVSSILPKVFLTGLLLFGCCLVLEVKNPMVRRFNTLYDRENQGNVTSACGCGIRPVYDYIPVGEKGRCKLVQVGEENSQGIIESWEESVDLHALLSRYLDGDATALERRQAIFADITGLPDNVHAYHDAAVTAQSVFDSLSDDVRHFYGDSVHQFLQGIFSGNFPPSPAPDDSCGDDPVVES